MSKSNSSNTLLIVLLVITFPIWIGLAAGAFGLVVGFFGLIFGLIAGAFGLVFGLLGGIIGAIAGIITWPFRVLFDWDYHPFYFSLSPLFIFIVAVIIALAVRSKRAGKSA